MPSSCPLTVRAVTFTNPSTFPGADSVATPRGQVSVSLPTRRSNTQVQAPRHRPRLRLSNQSQNITLRILFQPLTTSNPVSSTHHPALKQIALSFHTTSRRRLVSATCKSGPLNAASLPAAGQAHAVEVEQRRNAAPNKTRTSQKDRGEAPLVD